MNNQKRILLIADEKFFVELLEEVFSELGFNIETALDGKEGLRKMKSSYYDLVITDIVMPKMDGLEMLKKFNQTDKRQGKIIVFSNLTGKEVIERAFALGIDGYESTLLTIDHFIKRVKGYLEGKISKDDSKKEILKIQAKTDKEIKESSKDIEPKRLNGKTEKLLGFLIAPIVYLLILINFFSGVVGGIWLTLTGGLSLVLYGIALGLVMPFLYPIVFLPQMGLVILVIKFSENKNKIVTAIISFIASAYGNLVLATWTTFVFTSLVILPKFTLLPLLLWGYSTAMAPLSYMASKGSRDSPGTSIGLFFAQLSYLLLTALFFLGASNQVRNITICILILIFSFFTMSNVLVKARE